MRSYLSYKHPAEIIESRMIELDLSQTELAHKIGYKNPNFISILLGKKGVVPLSKVADFARVLKIDEFWLFEKVMVCRWPELEGTIDRLFSAQSLRKYAEWKLERAALNDDISSAMAQTASSTKKVHAIDRIMMDLDAIMEENDKSTNAI